MLFAGMYGSGVFRSTDDGITWQVWNDSLTNRSVECLGSDSDGNLLAGTNYSGVYRFAFPASNPEVTIGTNPAGRSFTVDGSAYGSPQTFNWPIGSQHQIGTVSPQAGPTGTRYSWSSWSFGNPMTFNYVVAAGSPVSLTARRPAKAVIASRASMANCRRSIR